MKIGYARVTSFLSIARLLILNTTCDLPKHLGVFGICLGEKVSSLGVIRVTSKHLAEENASSE